MLNLFYSQGGQAHRLTPTFIIEPEFEQRLCTDALFTSENIAQMPEALRQIGANQYADLLRRVIRTDFSDVRFPLSDEQLRHMRDRTEKACEELSNHRSAYDEFHRAVVSATCEMIIDVIDGSVDRRHDEEVGLNLFEF